MNLKALNRFELDQRLKSLAQKERDVLKEILLTIREIDSRKAYLEFGFPSLFEYLVEGVGYTNGSAQRRIDAARLIKDIPEVADLIQSGEINLNQITMVQKAVREAKRVHSQKVSVEDKRTLLSEISNKSERDAQKEIASFFDLPVVEAQVQKIQADESVRIELTLSKEAFEKLKHAQALLAHSVPTQDLAVFLEYISEKVIKQKTSYRVSNIPAPANAEVGAKINAGKVIGSTSAANEVKATTTAVVEAMNINSDSELNQKVKALSISVRKKVLKDHGCCQFKDPITGRVCGTKWFVQTDHKQSQWAGGNHAEANLQVLCGQHNRMKYGLEMGIRYR